MTIKIISEGECAGIKICPRCGTEDNDLTTIADHGMCRECLSMWQWGELPEQVEENCDD